MSTPVAERLARRWVRAYTRRLPEEARDARRAEVDSDLWEHRNDTRERGLSGTLAGLEVTGRLLAGVPADLAWRHAHLRAAHGARRTARIERNLMTTTAALPKLGYPTWLAILAALMGSFAALIGLAASVARMTGDESSGGWGFLLFTVGAVILVALGLVHRAPLASIVLLASGGLAFGAVTYWMVAPIFAGLAVAVGAVLAAPRILHSQPRA